MKTIYDLLKEHPFFKGFTDDELTYISSCGQNVVFKENEIIAKENTPADHFYLIRQGKIGISTHIAHHGRTMIQTVTDGEIFGWSWLFEPYRWMFDAIALETTLAIALNGKCLRGKLDETPVLGYKLMKRFAQLMISRLNATRLQLLDVYGKNGP